MAVLLPVEESILRGIESSLPMAQRVRFSEQCARINKVQRLLDWNEIEFYCMCWFKVQWPAEVLFDDRSEFELGSGTLQTTTACAELKVWSVRGHVFSIESKTPLKPFRTATDASFVLAAAAQPVAPADGFAAR